MEINAIAVYDKRLKLKMTALSESRGEYLLHFIIFFNYAKSFYTGNIAGCVVEYWPGLQHSALEVSGLLAVAQLSSTDAINR